MAVVHISPYISVVGHPAAFQLAGERARSPLVAGQMIIAHGLFDDSTETGAAVFLVLRGLGNFTYVLAPLGTEDPYWGDHLAKQPQVKARVMRAMSDVVPGDMELIQRWHLMSDPGEEPCMKDYDAFPKSMVESILPRWRFLNELVVSEKPQPQAGNDPPPNGNNK